jgi:catechol 2,3-dioxygenase-like lactoylglutathione lyase family enzyme
VDLHHVALASHDAGALVEPLVAGLGGTVLMGGENVGFRSYQVRLGDATDGMTLELLEPWGAERFDFLARFLARHGEGPHHLTFKVRDLAATLDRVVTAGYSPVGVSLSDPRWKEAFLQPRQAHGTVVQLAQAESPFADFAAEFEHLASNRNGEPVWWPEPPPASPRRTRLCRVVMATPNLDAALGFFAGVLGGSAEPAPPEAGSGTGPETAVVVARAAELVWPGGGRIRLEETVGTLPRVDRLELEVPGTARELQLAGTRLVVRAAGAGVTRAGDQAGDQSLR